MYSADLMFKAAKLYYENDLKQESVARRLNVSKYKVNRLLKEAFTEGIVKIEVINPDDRLLRKVK